MFEGKNIRINQIRFMPVAVHSIKCLELEFIYNLGQ